VTLERSKNFLAAFFSKEEDYSFSEKKAAKRLLFSGVPGWQT
jgi:hypothetical protein